MRTVLLVLLASMMVSGAAFGQTAAASLQGTITDPSKAVIPQAQIEVRNVGTGAVWNVGVDAEGHYLVPLLPPGEYQLIVTAPGFQKVTHTGIHLAVGQTAVVDAQLKIGATSTEVTVTSDAPGINLNSAALT